MTDDRLNKLIDQLNGDDWEQATYAAEALGKIGGPLAKSALQSRFKPYVFMTRDEVVDRFYFVLAIVLAEMGQFFEYGYVVNEDAPFVRERVKMVLEKVGTERCLNAAIAMQQSTDGGDRFWAAEIIAALSD